MPMRKASEYRAHAEQCWMMVRRTANPDHKAMLAKMAETWENLAKEREVHVARKQRIATLEGLTNAGGLLADDSGASE